MSRSCALFAGSARSTCWSTRRRQPRQSGCRGDRSAAVLSRVHVVGMVHQPTAVDVLLLLVECRAVHVFRCWAGMVGRLTGRAWLAAAGLDILEEAEADECDAKGKWQ